MSGVSGPGAAPYSAPQGPGTRRDSTTGAAGGLAPALRRIWPAPGSPTPRVAVAAAGAGLLAAVVAVAPRPGVGLTVAGFGVALALLPALRPHLDRVAGLTVAAVGGLLLVPTRSDSSWLSGLALVAALGVAAVVLSRAQRWPGVLLAAPLAVAAVGRAVPWAARGVSGRRLPGATAPLLRGLAVGIPAALLLGLLFASADDRYARLVQAVVPNVELGELPARTAALLLCAGVVLGGSYLLASRPRLGALSRPGPGGPPAEWAPALVLVALVTLAFVLIQAGALFGGHEVVLEGSGTTYADRAREGFGQLVLTTLITLAVLAWAGRRCRPGDRRTLQVLGGVLVALALLVVGSALHRLALYEQAYGLTVTRLVAGVFESWLGLVLLLVATAGLLGRGDWLARAAVLTGTLVLAGLTLVGPDAVVAASHVQRFERTGVVDTAYLGRLSADAVPALDRLPEPYRSCALQLQAPTGDGWTAWNLARHRAEQVLAVRPVLLPAGSSGCAGTPTSR